MHFRLHNERSTGFDFTSGIVVFRWPPGAVSRFPVAPWPPCQNPDAGYNVDDSIGVRFKDKWKTAKSFCFQFADYFKLRNFDKYYKLVDNAHRLFHIKIYLSYNNFVIYRKFISVCVSSWTHQRPRRHL